MAYHVDQRRRETAIRRALGADRVQVVGSVIGAGVRLAAAGLVVGTLAAVGVTRTLSSLLYRVAPTDPFALGAAVVVLAAAAILASAVPALRAARVDPMVILREE
jgi:ABC-type antimicrobial peptide transport system permease subunit